jgi:thioredoxin-like negative regulator of GroEL
VELSHSSAAVKGLASRPHVIAIALVVAAVAAYLPSANGPFFIDDLVYVVSNRLLRDLPLHQPWKLLYTRTNPYEFLPLRDLSYRLDLALFGLNPRGYHLHNLLLYVVNCGAVWLCTGAVTRLLWGPRALAQRLSWICATTTILFAVHPAHVESVAWISGRKDLLSGLFALLALWLFASALAEARLRLARLAVCYLLFTAGLLSKSTVISLPIIAFILALVRPEVGPADSTTSRFITSLRKTGLALALISPMFLIAIFLLQIGLRTAATTIVAAKLDIGALLQLATYDEALSILGYLTRISLFPVDLRLMYDVMEPGFPRLIARTLGVFTIAASGLGTWMLLRRRTPEGFGAVVFVFFCLPFLQFIRYSTWSLASERFLFLPIFGLAFVAAAAGSRLSWRWRMPVTVCVALIGILLTGQRSSTWSSVDELLVSNAERSPGLELAQEKVIAAVYLPQRKYGHAKRAAAGVREEYGRQRLLHLVMATNARDAGDWQAALPHAQWLANQTTPNTPSFVHMLIGSTLEANNSDFNAIRQYVAAEKNSLTDSERVRAEAAVARIRHRYQPDLDRLQTRVSRNPDDFVALGDAANLQMELCRLSEAEAGYRAILRRYPGHPQASYNLGLTLVRQGRLTEGASSMERALRGGLTTATVYSNLGSAYWASGELELAVDAFLQATAREPRNWRAPYYLGRAYLELRQFAEAQRVFGLARQRAAAANGPVELIDQYLNE